MSESADTRYETLQNLADKKNCDIVAASWNQLLLDLDTQEALDTFHVRYTRIRKRSIMVGHEIRWWRSTGHHIHVLIDLAPDSDVTEDYAPERRIRMQTALGSDPERDRLSIERIVEGISPAVALLRPYKAQVSCGLPPKEM